jgi:PDDEXK-like domain of unknown function (DUF3799)
MTFEVFLQSQKKPDNTGIIGWFDLHKIYSTCPAKYRWDERESNNVAAIAEHAAILNPAEFERRFIREPDKIEYTEALTTDKEICSWLKEKGVAGYSGKKFDELLALVDRTGDKPLIWKRFIDEFNQNVGIKTSVPAATYDKVLQMRAVIFGNERFAKIFEDSVNDVTIIGELHGVKIQVKYDAMTPQGAIVDYIGCTNASPEEFKNQAIRGGYYLKQALLHDVFVEAYGHKPIEQLILAQERNFPHIPEYYRVTDKFLEIGRTQYKTALQLIKQCTEKDIWPTYSLSDEVNEIIVPEYYAKQYGVGGK